MKKRNIIISLFILIIIILAVILISQRNHNKRNTQATQPLATNQEPRAVESESSQTSSPNQYNFYLNDIIGGKVAERNDDNSWAVTLYSLKQIYPWDEVAGPTRWSLNFNQCYFEINQTHLSIPETITPLTKTYEGLREQLTRESNEGGQVSALQYTNIQPLSINDGIAVIDVQAVPGESSGELGTNFCRQIKSLAEISMNAKQFETVDSVVLLNNGTPYDEVLDSPYPETFLIAEFLNVYPSENYARRWPVDSGLITSDQDSKYNNHVKAKQTRYDSLSDFIGERIDARRDDSTSASYTIYPGPGASPALQLIKADSLYEGDGGGDDSGWSGALYYLFRAVGDTENPKYEFIRGFQPTGCSRGGGRNPDGSVTCV